MIQTRLHYGYRRVHVMLKREGFKDNHKRVHRDLSHSKTEESFYCFRKVEGGVLTVRFTADRTGSTLSRRLQRVALRYTMCHGNKVVPA